MDFLFSLFGGALLIVLLYAVLGWLRLPNYWRAVISGGVVLLLYLVLIARHWPGLDVVAMHSVVFVATAAIMSLRANRRSQSAAKLHWAPKLIIGFFAVLFVVNGTLIYVASHGLPEFVAKHMPDANKGGAHTGFPGVTPHGEEAAKAVNSHLKEQAERRQQP